MTMAKHLTLIACVAAALMPALASAQTWPEGGVMSLTTGAGPEFGAYITQINAAMNDTAGVAQGTYSVQIADLSAFTTF